MITMEITKLVDAKFGKLAQIKFVKPGVGLIKTKEFMAWSFGVDKDAKIGDKAEVTMEEFSKLQFTEQILDKKDKDGNPYKCLKVKLA